MDRPSYMDPDVWARLLAQRPKNWTEEKWAARVATLNEPGRVRLAYCKAGRHSYRAMNGDRNGRLIPCPLH